MMKYIYIVFSLFFILTTTSVSAMTELERDHKTLYICQVLSRLKINQFEIDKPLPNNMNGHFLNRYALGFNTQTDNDVQKDFDHMLLWLRQEILRPHSFPVYRILFDLFLRGQEIDSYFKPKYDDSDYESVPVTSQPVNMFAVLRSIPFESEFDEEEQQDQKEDQESSEVQAKVVESYRHHQQPEITDKPNEYFGNIRLYDSTTPLLLNAED